MNDKYEGIDFSNRPKFMSMEQYADLNPQSKSGGTNAPPDVFAQAGSGSPSIPAPQAMPQQPAIDPRFSEMLKGIGGDGSVAPLNPSQPNISPAQPQMQAGQGTLPPMQAGDARYTSPQGGTVQMPSGQTTPPSPTTPQATGRAGDIAGQVGAIADKMGLQGEERDKFIKEQSQAQITKEAKAGIGAQAIQKSLEKQGIKATREEVAKAIGVDPAQMTREDAFRGLNRIQKREQNKRVTDRNEQRVNDRISERSKRNEDGSPANDSAIMEDFMNDFATPTGDPDNEKPLIDFMTPSQKREFQRKKEKASRTGLSDNDIGRLRKAKESAIEKAEKATARSNFKKESADRQARIKKAASDATTAASKRSATKLATETKSLESIVERLSIISKGNRTEQQQKRLDKANERLGQIDDQILGAQSGAPKPETSIDSGLVKMRAPNGQTAMVPKNKVQSYLDKNATIVE